MTPQRILVLLLALLCGACVPAPRTPQPPAGSTASVEAEASAPRPPDQTMPALFAAVQRARLFEDQKLFADAVPLRAPAMLEAEYLAQRDDDSFALHGFVETRFRLPRPVQATDVPGNLPLREHIDALWPLLTRRSPAPAPHDSLLPLPRPYVVPGGRFREVYYWDSYFTMLGLVDSGETTLARDMLANFAHLIDTYGHVPNGNRSYYLSRSQPPFFSHMVELLARGDPTLWIRYLPQLKREHAFWMDGAGDLAPGRAQRRVVRLPDGSLLNRYWDDRDAPRAESFLQDVETAERTQRPRAEVWRELRAGAESGWDYSSRWLDDPRDLSTIRTSALLPVDLNSLLHHLESSIARACAVADNQRDCTRDFTARAAHRKAAIEAHLWNPRGWYADYDWKRDRHPDLPTAAALYPLHAGIAMPERARATAETARTRLLRPGGLVTTTIETGQQWDAPNVWAPLQWIAVAGLRRYDEDALAEAIARNFLGNVHAVFEREHKLVEKYDADGPRGGGGGEYPLQDGFGWSNGVVRHLLLLYPQAQNEAPETKPAHSTAP
jgi:alpha,alpha-trehalase